MKLTSRISELDGLRTLAVFAVMLYHFSPHSHLFALGWAGVDLFFVISGFLITGILLNLRSGPSPFRTFYWRRTLRIFPPYYAMLAVIAALILVYHESFDVGEWMRALFFLPALKRGISVHLILQRLIGHAPFDFSHRPFVAPYISQFGSGVVVYWSLAVEELFYLLWAPVILKGSRRVILTFAIAPLFLCPILRGLTHTVNAVELYGFFTRFDELAMGGCIALWLRAKPNISKGPMLISFLLSLAAFSALCAYCGLFRGLDVCSNELFSICGYTLLALTFALLIAACVQWKGHRIFYPLRLRPVLYIGTISYTMYLTHTVMYVAVTRFLGGDLSRCVAAVSMTIGVAALSWKYFETPILRLRNLLEAPRQDPQPDRSRAAEMVV